MIDPSPTLSVKDIVRMDKRSADNDALTNEGKANARELYAGIIGLKVIAAAKAGAKAVNV